MKSGNSLTFSFLLPNSLCVSVGYVTVCGREMRTLGVLFHYCCVPLRQGRSLNLKFTFSARLAASKPQ